MNHELHWSQIDTPARRTVFYQATFPEFGKATVMCECGARAELHVTGDTNPRGRPRKTTSIAALVDEWCAEHFSTMHQGRTDWELRHRPTDPPPKEAT